jgi:hypothetical protein
MKRLILIAMVVLLSSSIAMAQDYCEGDFDYDGDCDADDVSTFLEDFGRSVFNNPCPEYPPVATFFDDFNDGDADGWIMGASCSSPTWCGLGNYRVENDQVTQDLGGDGYMFLVNKLQLSSHYVEVSELWHDNGGGGLAIWRKDDDNWVQVIYPVPIGIRVIEKWCDIPLCPRDDNVTSTNYPYEFTAREWQTIAIDANSLTGEISVYMDGEFVFTHMVGANINRIGLSGFTSGNAGATFDDFRIIAY